MDFLRFIKLLLPATVALIALDILWLGVIARKFYRSQLAPVLRQTPSYPASVGAWALIAAGLIIFVILQNTQTGYPEVLLRGALFGLIIYGVYNFTNLTTLKNWPLSLSFVDTLWGTFVCGAISVLLYYINSQV